jgi:hypothetical protein
LSFNSHWKQFQLISQYIWMPSTVWFYYCFIFH